MTKNRAFWISVVMVMGAAPLAMAKPAMNEARQETQVVTPLPRASTLADNVVVGGTTTAPAPAPAPVQPVVTQPVQPVVQPAPVVVEPTRRTEVREVSEPHNYVATIAVSALMGGLAGALIGGAVYYLDNQTHPYNIAYWAAGGVLVGTGVGVVQIMVEETRASQAVALDRLPSDPAPTYRLALYRATF